MGSMPGSALRPNSSSKNPAAPPMSRVEGSDLCYWPSAFEPDARLDYRIVVDSREAVLDPLNPNTVPGPQGPNSELRMPGYQQPPELQPPDLPVPSGTVSSHTLESQLLGQTRTFQVYEPPGQIVGQSLPGVIINNGSDYLNLINTPGILDSLIAGRQIPPLLAVFVTPINATEDYSLNDAYAGFLAEIATEVQAAPLTLSGSGFQVGIWDNGLVDNHGDFGSRLSTIGTADPATSPSWRRTAPATVPPPAARAGRPAPPPAHGWKPGCDGWTFTITETKRCRT